MTTTPQLACIAMKVRTYTCVLRPAIKCIWLCSPPPGRALVWAALEIHNTIAELMIFANSTVAEYIASAFPTQALLRRHPPPLDANLVEAAMVAARAGAKLKTESRAALSTSLKAVTTGNAQESAATDDRTTKRRRGAVDRLLRSLLTRGMAEAQYFCTGYVNVCVLV